MIYVDSMDIDRVVGDLVEALSGAVICDGRRISYAGLIMDGAHNDYSDAADPGCSDFVECDSSGKVSHEELVRGISAVLATLWGMGMRAVAVCDFEDELPARGGVDLY
jgi:hypothetical protein